jgi:hypothetical protein
MATAPIDDLVEDEALEEGSSEDEV